VVLGGLTVLDAGTEEQKKDILTKISNGDLIMTVALTEPSARYDAASVTVKATPDGDDYVINGTKLFVADANIADIMVCVTRTNEGASPEDGITLFLVDAKSPGIETTLLKTIAGDKLCEVVFDNVRVPKKNVLGELDKGWPVIERILEKATAALCAQMVGGSEATLEMSVNYAKERVQFGRPIGSFQAIQHHCANMVTDVDGSKYITYEAAWKVSEGLPATMEVSMAKAWVTQAYQRVTLLGHQIHGGIGFTEEHDMPLYFKRAKAAEATFGDADWHREVVAKQLGL
jgi:alkylation response protein AidB-like acyl-CoA dehydrogenase